MKNKFLKLPVILPVLLPVGNWTELRARAGRAQAPADELGSEGGHVGDCRLDFVPFSPLLDDYPSRALRERLAALERLSDRPLVLSVSVESSEVSASTTLKPSWKRASLKVGRSDQTRRIILAVPSRWCAPMLRVAHGSSILSEVDKTSISGRVSQTRQRCPLSWLPVSRFLPPRSGLERSDFVRWHETDLTGWSDDVRCSG